jgi:hypothetical protein
MSVRTLIFFLVLSSFIPVSAAEDRPQETVVLLHGILNRPFVMVKIQKGLEENGFRVLNWGSSREAEGTTTGQSPFPALVWLAQKISCK